MMNTTKPESKKAATEPLEIQSAIGKDANKKNSKTINSKIKRSH